ncbi:hypothetical protein ElyMa_003466100 [Elysia marginata]|uniref:Uncharacterized protein n=1 Tax=Elysia marginata TaxID=1093978 RepID=A0AAV4EB08_9GAST|nr:hypothetical protein ElyMa_003466100 [Elysia marginata]
MPRARAEAAAGRWKILPFILFDEVRAQGLLLARSAFGITMKGKLAIPVPYLQFSTLCDPVFNSLSTKSGASCDRRARTNTGVIDKIRRRGRDETLANSVGVRKKLLSRHC